MLLCGCKSRDYIGSCSIYHNKCKNHVGHNSHNRDDYRCDRNHYNHLRQKCLYNHSNHNNGRTVICPALLSTFILQVIGSPADGQYLTTDSSDGLEFTLALTSATQFTLIPSGDLFIVNSDNDHSGLIVCTTSGDTVPPVVLEAGFDTASDGYPSLIFTQVCGTLTCVNQTFMKFENCNDLLSIRPAEDSSCPALTFAILSP